MVLLFAARDGEPPSFDAPGLAELRLAGLPDDAAAELLAACAPAGLAPAVRDELVRLTRGNPLALTELPGALDPAQLAGRRSLSDPLPLTRAVEQAYLRRVRLLPPDTQALLDVAAAEDAGRRRRRPGRRRGPRPPGGGARRGRARRAGGRHR